jgi:hypothetical protein
MRVVACVTLIVAVLSESCGSPPATHVAQPAASTSTSADATGAPSDAGIDPSLLALVDAGTTLAPLVHSRFTFTDIIGKTGDQTAMIFTPTAQAIEECGVSRGGKLVVKLHTEKGKLVVEPQAGSSFDPAARQCVLDALTAANVDGPSNLGSGPMVRPTGFTSLLTIEW